MYQLPELARTIRDDQRRAAGHHRLWAPAYAGPRNGTWRGIVRFTGLRVRLSLAALRRAAQASWEN